MANKFSDSLRESILEEKNKVAANTVVINGENSSKNNSAKISAGTNKTLIEIQEELSQAYTSAIHNVNKDLLHYMSILPTDGNLTELSRATLSYWQLLQQRKHEMMVHSSNFCLSLFSVLIPKR